MAGDTFDGALLLFHHMENNGVRTTDVHDYGVQVYVEKIENSVRCLSLSVKLMYYLISRKIYEQVVHFGPWAFNGLRIGLRRYTEDQTRCVSTQCQPQLAWRTERQDPCVCGPARARGCGTREHH